MIYLALLRGINVGGNNKVEMKKLKLTFEKLGFLKVKTYINSGNIIFSEDLALSKNKKRIKKEIINLLQKAIKEDFGFFVRVLLFDKDEVTEIAKTLPSEWLNDEIMKTDVMFLSEEVNDKSIIKQLQVREEIDELKYVDGAILWNVLRKNIGRSGLLKLVGTKLYKEMTIRNCNSLRKLFALMQQEEA